jgi:hypothetical protein
MNVVTLTLISRGAEAYMAATGAGKTPSFAPFLHIIMHFRNIRLNRRRFLLSLKYIMRIHYINLQNNRFTKTGSGQTYRKVEKG